MPLKQLEDGESFSIDLRAPRSDPVAFESARLFFGSENVVRITQAKKRAVVTLELIESDIMEYDRVYSPRIDDPVYVAILESVRKDFVFDKPIVPWTLGKVEKHGVPKDKSPGDPWKSQGYRTKRDVLEDPVAIAKIHKLWSLVGNGRKATLADALVYFRSQICDRDVDKIRATWGYPIDVILEEGRFLYPYLEKIRHSDKHIPVAYGVEMALGGMGYIDDMFHRAGPGTSAIMLDWKKFDKTIPPWLIRDAFEILAQNFDFSYVHDSEDKEWPVKPIRSIRRWKKLVSYFINTPFRLMNGKRYRKDGGVPSGSGFTNIIDTIVNCIVTRYLMYHTTESLPIYDIYMGDDSVIMTKNTFNLDDFSRLGLSKFGMIVNVEKSYVTRERLNIFFLGFYNYYGHPFRDQDFLIASFIFPERYHSDIDPAFTAVRCLGQLWSTLNGIAAMKWLDILEYIVKKYQLPTNWLEAQMEAYPHSLKWLGLAGIDADKIFVPRRGGWMLMEVEAPLRPPHREPKPPDPSDMISLFKQYQLNYHLEDDYFASFKDMR